MLQSRCSLGTGVQTCALPISGGDGEVAAAGEGGAGDEALAAERRRELARRRVLVDVVRLETRGDHLGDAGGGEGGDVVGREAAPLLEGKAGAAQRVGEEAAFGLAGRSEEHTSELQSLMRISYAVFCLKKKTKTYTTTTRSHERT